MCVSSSVPSEGCPLCGPPRCPTAPACVGEDPARNEGRGGARAAFFPLVEPAGSDTWHSWARTSLGAGACAGGPGPAEAWLRARPGRSRSRPSVCPGVPGPRVGPPPPPRQPACDPASLSVCASAPWSCAGLARTGFIRAAGTTTPRHSL